MDKGKGILLKFKKYWQLLLWLKILIYALGIAAFAGFVCSSVLVFTCVFLAAVLFGAVVIQPWKISLAYICQVTDKKIQKLEYSSGLLFQNESNLTGLAKLQQQKISARLEKAQSELKVDVAFLWPLIISVFLIFSGFLLFYFQLFNIHSLNKNNKSTPEIVSFNPVDSVAAKSIPPNLIDQRAIINYPGYTNLASKKTSEMKIRAVIGSSVTWELEFDSKVASVYMESMGTSYPMKLSGDKYKRSNILSASGFYNFRFKDTSGNEYASKLYTIEVVEDAIPEIEIKGIPKFLIYETTDDKQFSFEALVKDDFGIADAYIIATVSKGTGESVKFREEKLIFSETFKKGKTRLELSKTIDLDQFKMEAGDELYFYVEALDFKQPIPGKARSETYFAAIKDTTTNNFEVEGTMGADLMPDYFRSQRQLIIDTEKLISQRKKISKTVFNTTSNDLGFDQKALRLKYGQFMGDEADSGLDLHNNETVPEDDESGNDPLAEYTHDHDGENDHNLVDKKETTTPDETSKNPLSQFTHDHDNAEEATLFTDSLKSKLRQALDLMWDAELHLRMYEPEKSLPFQYKILKLLQEIKNSARIYVHRIGFDPPPIKNEVRLTGKIEEVKNYEKSEILKGVEKDTFIKKSILILEKLIDLNSEISKTEKIIFEKAGSELALIAIENPGQHLKTLQMLKLLTQENDFTRKELLQIQKGLINAVSPFRPNPNKIERFSSTLDSLMLKELENNE